MVGGFRCWKPPTLGSDKLKSRDDHLGSFFLSAFTMLATATTPTAMSAIVPPWPNTTGQRDQYKKHQHQKIKCFSHFRSPFITESLDLVESVLSIIKDTLADGETLKVSGFGNFVVKAKSDRRGRNPQTGEEININARRVLTFKPSAMLKDAMNKSVTADS